MNLLKLFVITLLVLTTFVNAKIKVNTAFLNKKKQITVAFSEYLPPFTIEMPNLLSIFLSSSGNIVRNKMKAQHEPFKEFIRPSVIQEHHIHSAGHILDKPIHVVETPNFDNQELVGSNELHGELIGSSGFSTAGEGFSGESFRDHSAGFETASGEKHVINDSEPPFYPPAVNSANFANNPERPVISPLFSTNDDKFVPILNNKGLFFSKGFGIPQGMHKGGSGLVPLNMPIIKSPFQSNKDLVFTPIVYPTAIHSNSPPVYKSVYPLEPVKKKPMFSVPLTNNVEQGFTVMKNPNLTATRHTILPFKSEKLNDYKDGSDFEESGPMHFEASNTFNVNVSSKPLLIKSSPKDSVITIDDVLARNNSNKAKDFDFSTFVNETMSKTGAQNWAVAESNNNHRISNLSDLNSNFQFTLNDAFGLSNNYSVFSYLNGVKNKEFGKKVPMLLAPKPTSKVDSADFVPSDVVYGKSSIEEKKRAKGIRNIWHPINKTDHQMASSSKSVRFSAPLEKSNLTSLKWKPVEINKSELYGSPSANKVTFKANQSNEHLGMPTVKWKTTPQPFIKNLQPPHQHRVVVTRPTSVTSQYSRLPPHHSLSSNYNFDNYKISHIPQQPTLSQPKPSIFQQIREFFIDLLFGRRN